jgi:hypothetical protein
VAVSVVGGFLDAKYFDDVSLYDRDYSNCVTAHASATDPAGYCPQALASEISRPQAIDKVSAIAGLSVGGAVALAGLYMILENSPHVVSATVERDHVAITLQGRW